jgi:hypothetical protein
LHAGLAADRFPAAATATAATLDGLLEAEGQTLVPVGHAALEDAAQLPGESLVALGEFHNDTADHSVTARVVRLELMQLGLQSLALLPRFLGREHAFARRT